MAELTLSTTMIETDPRADRGGQALIAEHALAVPFFAVWAFSLSRNIFDPPGFDQAFFQYCTDQILAGRTEHAPFWFTNAMGPLLFHVLATLLFGAVPMAMRLMDLVWQIPVFAGFVWLGGRDRRWAVGWLAATLYALVYYGMGYVHTGQREGLAVMPMMILAHLAVTPTGSSRSSPARTFLLWMVGGLAGFLAFSIKPTLGAAFGAIWLYVLIEAVRARSVQRQGRLAPIGGLTLGFIGSASLAAAICLGTGLWSGWGDAIGLGRAMPPGYCEGPDCVRRLWPYMVQAFGLLAAGAMAWLVMSRRSVGGDLRRLARRVPVPWVVALTVFGLLALHHKWPASRSLFTEPFGVLIPALGGMFALAWRERSPAWRACALLMAASALSVLIQGKFFVYHMLPLFAFGSYLSADELVRGFDTLPEGSRRRQVWLGVCLAGVCHLAFCQWFYKMTFHTASPYVLAGTTLDEHYTGVTRHKRRYPAWGTTVAVARYVRERTSPDEPIVCLFRYPRLYYLARRPVTHPLISVNGWFRHLFPEFLGEIKHQRPRIAIARVPRHLRGMSDKEAATAGVFAEVESLFGEQASFLRDRYRLSAVMDDVAILERRTP